MNQLTRFRQFVSEVWAELKRTTWPSQKEVRGTTIVVVTFVIVCAVYLYVVDLGLSWAVTKVFEVFQ